MVVRHALLQMRTARQAYAGGFHLMVFAGFIVLMIATTVVMLDFDLHTEHHEGPLLPRLSIADRRSLWRPGAGGHCHGRRAALDPAPKVSWSIRRRRAGLLALIFAIVVTGFLVEGWRIAATHDPWAAWSPIGNVVAALSAPLMSESVLRTAHAGGWWLHLLLVYGFIAWAPFTKLLHIVTAPLSIYTANLDGYGRGLKAIDFESEAPLGVASLEQFSWKDLLDLDACTECGRCTAVCPANTVGKSLSPRDIVLDLRSLMHGKADELLATRGTARGGAADPGDRRGHRGGARGSLLLHHLRRVPRGLPGLHRAAAQDPRHPALPGHGGGRLPPDHGRRHHLAGAAWTPVPRRPVLPRGLGRRARCAGSLRDGRSVRNRRSCCGWAAPTPCSSATTPSCDRWRRCSRTPG